MNHPVIDITFRLAEKDTIKRRTHLGLRLFDLINFFYLFTSPQFKNFRFPKRIILKQATRRPATTGYQVCLLPLVNILLFEKLNIEEAIL